MVARIINGRDQLNISREIFFVQIGGFDTHSGQLTSQANLFQQLAQAMTAFYNATVEMGVSDSVTQFTASDFSRTSSSTAAGPTTAGAAASSCWAARCAVASSTATGR